MGQMGFFDLARTGIPVLTPRTSPLLKIDGVVPWEDLRARLEAVWRYTCGQGAQIAGGCARCRGMRL